MSRRGKAWLVCHFCIFIRMVRFSLESLTTPRAIPNTTFTSSSLSFVSLSWAVLNSSNFFASPSTLRGASKVMKSDTGNNFAVDAGVGGCIDAAEGGPWVWGMFKAHTLLLCLVYLGEWDWRPCWAHLLQHWCQHLAHRGRHYLRRILWYVYKASCWRSSVELPRVADQGYAEGSPCQSETGKSRGRSCYSCGLAGHTYIEGQLCIFG